MTMSSVEKGDQFEKEVFDYIKNHVESGNTYLNPKFCKFHLQKGYYSSKRDSNIKFDVTIECFMPDADEYSHLVVIECKNYKSPVKIDDLEEFESKLKQVSGVNVKGMFFTRSSFQKGAMTFGKNTKMALIRVLPNENVVWDLYRSPISSSNKVRLKEDAVIVETALLTEEYVGKAQNVYCVSGGIFTSSYITAFNKIIEDIVPAKERSLQIINFERKVDRFKKTIIPFLGFNELEIKSKHFIESIYTRNVEEKLDFELIISYFTENYNITFVFDENLGSDKKHNEILGQISVAERVIKVSSALEINSPRWRFTLAHELSHLVLHHDFFSNDDVYNELINNLQWSESEQINSDIQRLEWQANAFASCMLVPKDELIEIVKDILVKLNVNHFNHGVIYLDEQACNLNTFKCISRKVKTLYGVSEQSVELRLKQLRLLNDNRSRVSDLPH
ncbi:ImmA/IrrE family metallo-endopeptidase [Photobacterium phosphoreum]|nr:ImmA/IrrE family metallo-endopeptidase [Photobacterium phosphoreum]